MVYAYEKRSMSTTITLPYDPVWTALRWAKEYCPSYITNAAEGTGMHGDDSYKIVYYFGSEKDAMTFALKWS